MADITVRQGGIELQPADDQALVLTVRAPDALDLVEFDANVGEFYYDYWLNPEIGKWQRYEAATYDSATRSFRVPLPHLSPHNVDIPRGCSRACSRRSCWIVCPPPPPPAPPPPPPSSWVQGRVKDPYGRALNTQVNATGTWGWGASTSTRGSDGWYQFTIPGLGRSTTISPASMSDLQFLPPSVTQVFAAGQTYVNVDFQACLPKGAACVNSEGATGQCCSGGAAACDDKFCF
jgi:hypothetical protein